MLQWPEIRGLWDYSIALAQFLDEIPIGIAVLDPDRKVVMVNRALEALTGFVRPEVYGIPCWYLLRSNLCLNACPIAQAKERAESVCVEANIINRSRQKVPVRVTAAAIADTDGKLVGFVESIEDLRAFHEAEEAEDKFVFGKLIGRSPKMKRVFQALPVIAQTDSSVLITGQTGTGKDFLAEAIHQMSVRAKGPFVKVNCGALPETLLESELFGHQKGAFTGAVENKPGRFRLAHNGTLYLTEIGDLPLNLQVKLLSFLDDKVVYPLGSSRGFNVDVRVIAATHRNLEKMVREGKFREDLLFRLNVVRLHLPPLAERGEDVKTLLDHFLLVFNARFKKKVSQITKEVYQTLLNYHYPGNVRELRNIVEFAVNICEGDRIHPRHLPEYISQARPLEPENGSADLDNGSALQPDKQDPAPNLSWAETERKLIVDAMIRSRGRRMKAAELLGWDRSTLWRKMKRYGISG